jgi:hypothetical protein
MPRHPASCVTFACRAAALLLAMAAGSAAAQHPGKPADDPLLRQLNEMLDKDERERKAGRGPKHAALPPQDPCTVIGAAQIKRLLPAAQAGQRDHLNDRDGIARCVWKSAAGLVQLKLELRAARDDDADRMPPLPAGGAVRRPGGAGEGAIVFFMPADPKTGLQRNLAAGQARRGKVKVSIESDELALQGAQPALGALQALLEAVRL